MRLSSQLLDDPAAISHYNQGKILESAYYFPEQCRRAWEDAYETIVPPNCFLVDNIIFAGMGGSAIPGRIIDSLADTVLKVPFEVVDRYHLPSYVNERTLVIAASYSGNTIETLNIVEEARSRGAQLFCITTGGELEKIAHIYSLPGYYFQPEFNPSNQPRMASGYLTMAVLGMLSKCSLIHFNHDLAMSMIHYLKSQVGNFMDKIPHYQNPAKLMAMSLAGKLPIIITSGHLTGGAQEFKNLLNENSKTLCMTFDIPELDHNLIEGLSLPHTNSNNLIFITLESSNFHPEIQKNFSITKDIIKQNGIELISFHTRSGKIYIESMEIIQLSQFVSFYLAVINNIDPAPVHWINKFKSALSST